jgi:hypothetical protein
MRCRQQSESPAILMEDDPFFTSPLRSHNGYALWLFTTQAIQTRERSWPAVCDQMVQHFGARMAVASVFGILAYFSTAAEADKALENFDYHHHIPRHWYVSTRIVRPLRILAYRHQVRTDGIARVVISNDTLPEPPPPVPSNSLYSDDSDGSSDEDDYQKPRGNRWSISTAQSNAAVINYSKVCSSTHTDLYNITQLVFTLDAEKAAVRRASQADRDEADILFPHRKFVLTNNDVASGQHFFRYAKIRCQHQADLQDLEIDSLWERFHAKIHHNYLASLLLKQPAPHQRAYETQGTSRDKAYAFIITLESLLLPDIHNPPTQDPPRSPPPSVLPARGPADDPLATWGTDSSITLTTDNPRAADYFFQSAQHWYQFHADDAQCDILQLDYVFRYKARAPRLANLLTPYSASHLYIKKVHALTQQYGTPKDTAAAYITALQILFETDYEARIQPSTSAAPDLPPSQPQPVIDGPHSTWGTTAAINLSSEDPRAVDFFFMSAREWFQLHATNEQCDIGEVDRIFRDKARTYELADLLRAHTSSYNYIEKAYRLTRQFGSARDAALAYITSLHIVYKNPEETELLDYDASEGADAEQNGEPPNALQDEGNPVEPAVQVEGNIVELAEPEENEIIHITESSNTSEDPDSQ